MIKPLRTNVMGRMLELPGSERRSRAGIILVEDELTEGFVRPRWFEITHVGPEQTDVVAGQYALVAHGRWSHGIDIENTRRDQDKLFLLDHNDILGVQDDNPLS